MVHQYSSIRVSIQGDQWEKEVPEYAFKVSPPMDPRIDNPKDEIYVEIIGGEENVRNKGRK